MTTRSLPRRVTTCRSAFIGVALVVALFAALTLSLTVGSRTTTLLTVVDALTHADPTNGDHAVVLARIPRTLTGLIVGAALGLAGAGMQGVTRNPLADPGVLGVNAGASLAVVGAIYLLGAQSINVFMWFAFAGAAAAALVVYLVASLGREGATPIKLALAGAALAAGLSSIMSAILMLSQEALDTFRFWHVGTLGARSLEDIARVAPYVAVGAFIVLASSRSLNALSLGDDTARGLGTNVHRARIIAGLGVVLLCGGAVALAGPIAFVGLVIPHAVRLLAGSSYLRVLPLSLLAGPAFLLTADVIGRVILPPKEVQVGVMTALIGAPVFIWLIRARKKVGL